MDYGEPGSQELVTLQPEANLGGGGLGGGGAGGGG